jgi:hypothetical protein
VAHDVHGHSATPHASSRWHSGHVMVSGSPHPAAWHSSHSSGRAGLLLTVTSMQSRQAQGVYPLTVTHPH